MDGELSEYEERHTEIRAREGAGARDLEELRKQKRDIINLIDKHKAKQEQINRMMQEKIQVHLI